MWDDMTEFERARARLTEWLRKYDDRDELFRELSRDVREVLRECERLRDNCNPT